MKNDDVNSDSATNTSDQKMMFISYISKIKTHHDLYQINQYFLFPPMYYHSLALWSLYHTEAFRDHDEDHIHLVRPLFINNIARY